MKAIRIIVSLLAGLAIVVLTIWSEQLTAYALEALSFGWTNAYLLPRFLVLILAAATLVGILPLLSLSKVWKWILGVVILSASIGGYLSVNLPYIDDWIRGGDALGLNLDGNQIETQLNSIDSDYDGLIFLVLPNCPYCFDAYPNIERLKKRNTDLDVSVFVSAKDSSGLKFFKEHIGETELPIYMISDYEQATTLSQGKFPTFLYFKNGRVVYRWSNNQFGYPALDWVEKRLN